MSLSLGASTSYSGAIAASHTIPFPAGADEHHPFIFVMTLSPTLRLFHTDGVDSESNVRAFGNAGLYLGVVVPKAGETQFIVAESVTPAALDARMIVLTDTQSGVPGGWEHPFTDHADRTNAIGTGSGDYTINWTEDVGFTATIDSPWGDTADWVWMMGMTFQDNGSGNALPSTPSGWTLQDDFTWTISGANERTGWYTKIERGTTQTLPVMTSGVSDWWAACSFTVGFWLSGGSSGWGVIIS